MLEFYLPVAHMDVGLVPVLLLGLGVGMISGLTGVGGGFLVTPLLILGGVPPMVAVGTAAAQTAGTSAAGSLSHWRLGNVDAPMGLLLLLGAAVGGAGGVFLAQWLEARGQFGNLVSLLYVVVLGGVGVLMLGESLSTGRRGGGQGAADGPGAPATWLRGLPMQRDFAGSGVRLALPVPVLVGFGVGLLAALMGVGGGFLLVPVMIYVLGMPTRLAVGTALFQQVFMTALVAVMQAGVNQAVDPLLALVLVLGAAVGSRTGSLLATRLPGHRLRLILALLVLAVALRMLLGLLLPPEDAWFMQRLVTP